MSRGAVRRWTLRGRLSRNVLSAVALGWAVMIALALVALGHEMNEVLDNEMEAVVGLSVQFFDSSDDQTIPQILGFQEEEGEKALRIFRAGGPVPDAPWGRMAGDGFYDLDGWRVLRQSTGGTIIEIGQSKAWRREEMLESAGFFLVLMAGQLVLLLVIRRAVNASMEPVDRFARTIAGRRPEDMSDLPADNLAEELAPLALALNGYLGRIRDLRDAERQFVANAAHELRTPLAGAIAQAQRLRSETRDPAAEARAAEIEATLKRLTRLSERLLQLARAEGGRLRMDRSADLRAVARFVVGDIARTVAPGRIAHTLPETPVMSDLDPDAFGILCRNLLENALRHGAEGAPVEVTLSSAGVLIVANDGPVVPRDALDRLTGRFERAGASAGGSGLGLAIVAAIANRIGSPLLLQSPRPGSPSGFQATVRLPTDAAGNAAQAGTPTP